MEIELKELTALLADLATLGAVIVLIVQLNFVRISSNASTYQRIMSDERDVWEQIEIDNVDLTAEILKDRYPNIPELEDKKATFQISLLFDHWEQLYFLYRQHAFPKKLWPSWEHHIVNLLNTEKISGAWEATKEIYWSEFVDYFDKRRSPQRRSSGSRATA